MRLTTKDMILVSVFSALMVAGAFVKIPFPYLPITLQPFFCALAGILLGSRLGFISQFIYLLLGLAGLPVFANGGGITYFLQPSFGFILGFAAAAFVIGKLSEALKTINMKNTLISLLAGLGTIYALGIPYMYLMLAVYMGKPGITMGYVVSVNFPYFIKDLILYIVIAVSVNSALPVLKRARLINLP